jgi:hypothetical protein
VAGAVKIAAALREYVETPDRFSHVPADGSVQRFADERVCVLQGPTWASISGVRVGEGEVGTLLAEVREHVPADKEPVWWIGPSTRPATLHEQLLELGLRTPRDRATLLHGLLLGEEPEAPSKGIDVCMVETYEQFVAARELQWEVFRTPEHRRARNRLRLRQDFEESRRAGVPVAFLATLDGRPAASAVAIPSDRGVFLIGGATAPWARGRGLYRALVRARWDFAVARGTPALVTHALPDTSFPILRRLGFQKVCRIRRLEDLRP